MKQTSSPFSWTGKAFLLLPAALMIVLHFSGPDAIADVYTDNFMTTAYMDSNETDAEWNTAAGDILMPYFVLGTGATFPSYISYYCPAELSPDFNVIYIFGTGSGLGVDSLDTVNQLTKPFGDKLTHPAQRASIEYNPTNNSFYLFGGYYPYHQYIQVVNANSMDCTVLNTTLPKTLFNELTVYAPSTEKMYLFGGYSVNGVVDTILVFDPETEEISESDTTLPKSLQNIGGAYCNSDGKIYLFGGDDEVVMSNTVYRFDPVTETITPLLASLPYVARSLRVIYDPTLGQMLLLKGYIQNMYTQSNYIFRFNTQTGITYTHRMNIPNSAYTNIIPNSDVSKLFVIGGSSSTYFLELGYPAMSTAQSIQINSCSTISTATLLSHYSLNKGGFSEGGQTGERANSVVFSLTRDGGTTWQTVQTGVPIIFTPPAYDLRWRIQMTSDGTGESPLVHDLSIDYTIVPDTTPPSMPVITDEGDFSANNTYLFAEWDSTEETCILDNSFSIGTGPGLTDVVDWTSIGWSSTLSLGELNLQDCQTYYINVRTTNQDGFTSEIGTSDGITIMTDANALISFNGLDTSMPAQQCYAAELNWNAADLNSCASGLDVHYNIYRSFNPLSGFMFISSCTEPVEDLSFIDEGLVPGLTYYYMVRAEIGTDVTNGSGYCHGLEEHNFTLQSINLNNPISFNGIETLALSTENCGAVDLTWNAAQSSCTNADFHYHIYRRSEGASVFTRMTDCSDFVTETQYQDTEIFTNDRYYYYIQAEDNLSSTGNGPCDGVLDTNNRIQSIMVPTLSPTFGGLTGAEGLDNHVALTWAPALPACPGSDIHYNIYRSLDPLSGFTCISNCYTPVTNTSFEDWSVTSTTTYYYMVRAEDDAALGGGTGECGGNEDVNCVILPATPFVPVPTLFMPALCLLLGFMSLLFLRKRNR